MKKLALFILGAVGIVVCEATTGDCYRRAVALAASQTKTVVLVNEYDPDFGDYCDYGCYYFKITCQRGKSYTVYTSNESDWVGMSIDDISMYDWDREEWCPRFDVAEDKYSEANRGILYAEDWDEDTPAKAVYYVRLEGEIGTRVSVTFREGVITENIPIGDEMSPFRITMNNVPRSQSFVQLCTGEFWFQDKVYAGRKYVVETTSGTAAFPVALRMELESFPGVVRSVSKDSFNERWEIYPDASAPLLFSVCSDAERPTTVKYFMAGSRPVSSHESVPLAEGDTVQFSPGRKNSDGSDFYDSIIDEQLFSFSAEVGKVYSILTSGAATNMLMVLYDGKGNELLQRTSDGSLASFDVNATFSLPKSGAYYVGICENLADERIDAPTDVEMSASLRKMADEIPENAIRYRLISFEAMGGTCRESERILPEGQTIGRLPVPSMPKYDFLGWFRTADGSEKVTGNDIVVSDITCYAHWRAVRRLDFGENCGNDACGGGMDQIACDPGEEVEIPECGFIREGRTFAGWSTNPNGTVEYHPGDIVTMDDDILLYAIWDGPPRFIVDEWGNLEYFEMNGASEVHIPDTVKYISAGMLDALPDSLFDTNSIPCLRMLDGWVVGVTDDYWNTYGTGEEDAPCWNLDLSGIRGVVDGAFWGDLRISSLVATQPVLDAGVSAMFGTSVSSVVVADGATAIWQHSLSYLENLTNLTIASSVAIVEQDAFDGCPESLFKTDVVSGLKTVDGWVVGLAEDYWDIYGQCDELGRLVNSELDLAGSRGVAEYALQNAEYAYSVFFPDDLLSVGDHSFSGCPISAYSVASGNPNYSSSGGMLLSKDGKTLIRVPQGMWKVHVPEGVETVAHGAFCDSGHGIVVFPATVTKIDDGAFLGCSIDRVVFNGDAPEVDDGTVADLGCGMVYISDDAEGWGESLPGEWHGLPTDSKDVEFSIDENGWLAWVEPKGTTGIRIPAGVTKILGGAFGDCWMIDSVKIPSSVTSIEQGAFDGCDNSFFDTDTIPGVKVADGWVVGLSDDYWNVVEPCGIELNVELWGIRGISDYAFQGASMLVSADIPDSVRQIGDGAFESCANLLRVRLGSGVERIGAYAFSGCHESLFASGIRSGFVVAMNSSYSSPMFDVLMVGDWVVGWTVINASGYTTMELSGVRGIADRAFEGCGELSGLSAHSLEHVGANAFDGCQDSLFDVSSVPGARVVAGWIVGPSDGGSQNGELVVKSARGIADGSFAFTDVQLVVIGVDCERIGQSAFQGCANLVHAKIGQGVSEIGVNAFAWCNEELYDTATASGASLVDGWVVGCTIPQNGIVDLAGVRGLSDYAFADCDEIEEVRLADGLVRISSGAFSGCGNLRSVSIPDSVTGIGHFAFDGCGGLFGAVHASQGLRIVDGWAVGIDQIAAFEGDVVLPSLRGIADFAFAGCRAMTSVVVPKSVIGIGYGSFSRCASLCSMVLPFVGACRGNSDAPDAVFGYIFGSMPYSGATAVRQTFREPVYSSGCSYGYAPGARYERVYYVPASLKRVEITDETHLGYAAFYGCDGLEYVSLNEGLSEISDYAFASCAGLAAVDIPRSVEEIGDSVFCGCSALKSITLGEDVAYIGYCAFGECTELRDVYFLGDAPYAEYDVFDGASKRMTIHVAPGTTGWLSGSTDELPSYWPCYLDGEHDGYGRRIKFAHTEPSEDGSSGSGGGTQGGVSGVVTGDLLLTITNVVIHYVTQSIPSSAVIPSATAGIVNIVSEVNAGSAVAITQEWAAQYPGFASKFGSDFTKAVTAQTGKVDGAGKPMLVWQDFVAGTDPTNPEDVFQASITFDAETGEPVISWTPELPSAEAAKRLYRKYGKVRLTDEDWTLVTDDASAYNFFKVSVEMR
ncbi:MAG: leucine-rich repeat protein [Kiritimatiellae bacterium]|nr:leucine-rich repeat protein [Kiritimatiellia bacterium]